MTTYRSVPLRVLLDVDSYCPSCGHNRDKSSVSSIDRGDGEEQCQICGTSWQETVAEQPGYDTPMTERIDEQPDHAAPIAHSKSQYKRMTAQGANPVMEDQREPAAQELPAAAPTSAIKGVELTSLESAQDARLGTNAQQPVQSGSHQLADAFATLCRAWVGEKAILVARQEMFDFIDNNHEEIYTALRSSGEADALLQEVRDYGLNSYGIISRIHAYVSAKERG